MNASPRMRHTLRTPAVQQVYVIVEEKNCERGETFDTPKPKSGFALIIQRVTVAHFCTPFARFSPNMPSNNPRVVTVIPPHLHGRMVEKLAGSGVTVSEYIRRLIAEDLEGHQDYMVRLVGHRVIQASVHLAALAKDRFTEDQFAQLRTIASDMGVAAFGPLPVRPYDFEKGSETTGQVQALHDLLDGV